MGTLSFEVREFIEDNIDLIDRRAWDQIYDNAQYTLDSESTGAFTLAMLEVNVDPLETLDYIPNYYLSDAKIKSFKIPDHIRELGEGCFSYSSLKEIVIPDSVTTIGMYAFYGCPQLKRVVIPPTIRSIEGNSFQNTNCVIVCKQESNADYLARFHDLKVEYY